MPSGGEEPPSQNLARVPAGPDRVLSPAPDERRLLYVFGATATATEFWETIRFRRDASSKAGHVQRGSPIQLER